SRVLWCAGLLLAGRLGVRGPRSRRLARSSPRPSGAHDAFPKNLTRGCTLRRFAVVSLLILSMLSTTTIAHAQVNVPPLPNTNVSVGAGGTNVSAGTSGSGANVNVTAPGVNAG